MNRFQSTRAASAGWSASEAAARSGQGASRSAATRPFFGFAVASVLVSGCGLFPDLSRLSGAKVVSSDGGPSSSSDARADGSTAAGRTDARTTSPKAGEPASCAIVGEPTYVKASEPHPWALFGAAVAATDGLFVVTAPTDSKANPPEPEDLVPTDFCPNRIIPTQPAAGAIYVYEEQGGTWTESRLDIADLGYVEPYLPRDTGPNQTFFTTGVFPTYSVAVSKKRVIVGIGGDDKLGLRQGSVRVFDEIAPSRWKETQRIDPRAAMNNDLFGMSVSLSGTTLVIGVPGRDGAQADSGAADVYELNGTKFVYSRTLEPTEPQPSGWFGASIAQSDDFVVIGAPREIVEVEVLGSQARQGTAYAFDKSRQFKAQRITTTMATDARYVGTKLSIDGDLLAVGVPGASGCQNGKAVAVRGAVLLYSLVDGTWSGERCLEPSDYKALLFGYDVALSSGTLVVGAPFSFGGEAGKQPVIDVDAALRDDDSGSVYVFSGVDTENAPEPCHLKAPNVGLCDDFGVSVAFGGGNVLVGAAWEDSNEGGIGAAATDDDAANAGAVYLYPTSK